MSTETKPFSPFLTQQYRDQDLSKILDRNLLAIKAALDVANATINKQQTIINQIISGDTIINFTGATGKQGPPGLDPVDEDGTDAGLMLPGPPGARGRDGVGIPGQDADDAEPGLPGPPGRDGKPGQAVAPMEVDEDVPEPMAIPPGPRLDSVSFHYYINELTGMLGVSGWLAPSSQVVIAVPGSSISFRPSYVGIFRRGQLMVEIINNGLAGAETCVIGALINGGGAALGSVTLAAGTAGHLAVEFATGTTNQTDVYGLFESCNGSLKNIQYSACLRLFEI